MPPGLTSPAASSLYHRSEERDHRNDRRRFRADTRPAEIQRHQGSARRGSFSPGAPKHPGVDRIILIG